MIKLGIKVLYFIYSRKSVFLSLSISNLSFAVHEVLFEFIPIIDCEKQG